MHRLWKLAAKLVTLGFALTLAACGGGGGGSSSSGLPAAYEGETTQAAIDQNNAEAIALNAYAGGVTTGEMGMVFPMAVNGQSGSEPRYLELAQALKKAAGQAAFPSVKMAASETFTEYGDCGNGPMTFSINANESTGAVSGTMTFAGYCDGGLTMNGQVTFSGSVKETSSGYNINLTMKFSQLIAQEAGADSFTADGTVSFSFSMDFEGTASSSSMTMNLVLTDGSSGSTYYLKNFKIQITEGSTGEDINISGRFYDYDAGYVDIITLSPLTISWADAYPSSGTLKFSGASGTWATMTFTGGGNYEIVCSDGAVLTGTL